MSDGVSMNALGEPNEFGDIKHKKSNLQFCLVTDPT